MTKLEPKDLRLMNTIDIIPSHVFMQCADKTFTRAELLTSKTSCIPTICHYAEWHTMHPGKNR